MKSPPRNPKDRLFSLRSVGLSVLQGVSVLAVVLAVFWWAGGLGHPEEDGRRALVFATLVVANVCVERLWRTVKHENIYLKAYATVRALESGLSRYFEFYCHQRIHQSLDYRTPAEVYRTKS